MFPSLTEGTLGWWIALGISLPMAAILMLERFRKFVPELQRLNAEIASRSADTLEKMQLARAKYFDVLEDFTDYSKRIIVAIENSDSPETVDQARDRACRLLSKAMRAHMEYVEFVELYHKGSPDALEDFICDDLCADVDRFAFRVRVINNPTLIQKTGQLRSPMIINRTTTKPWQRLLQSLPEIKREAATQKLWSSIAELLRQGHDPDTRV